MAVETGGALALVYKGAALILGTTAATYLVLSMQLPKDDKEWKHALLTTVISSLCGGCAVIQYFELKHWLNDWVGTIALGGVFFTCALPGWFLVRAVFIWQRQNESKSITALFRELFSIWRGNSQQ